MPIIYYYDAVITPITNRGNYIAQGGKYTGVIPWLLPRIQAYVRILCTIYNDKYFSERCFSYIVCVLTWRAWRHTELLLAIAEMLWIHVLDTPSCYEWGVGRKNVCAASHPIGQNCRAVCKREALCVRAR